MKRFLGFLVVMSLISQSHVMAQVRKYGPLRLDLRNVRKDDFAFIVPAINKQDQTLFLGIYCEERLFNFTGAGGQWKEWDTPQNVYEARIIADICNQI